AWKDGGRFYDQRFQAWKDGNRFCDRRLQAWKGGSFFSPRHGTASWVRNGGGCAAIGAGFTATLRSYGKSGVERVTAASAIGDSGVGRVVASSPVGGWRSLGRETPWMRAARRSTLLHIPLLYHDLLLSFPEILTLGVALFKAPVGSPDLRLDFFAPEVQAD
ncbi:hypothetical protein GW17_00062310, partial [Ensete ventricosum]